MSALRREVRDGRLVWVNGEGLTFDEWYETATQGAVDYPRMRPGPWGWFPTAWHVEYVRRVYGMPASWVPGGYERWVFLPRPLSDDPHEIARRRAFRVAREKWRAGVDPTEVMASRPRRAA